MFGRTSFLKLIGRGISLAIFIFALGLSWSWVRTPSFGSILKLALGSDRVLLDHSGQPLQTLRVDFEKRRLSWQKLESFPTSLREAVLSVEDHRFYSHHGIDFLGLGRALFQWIENPSRRIQGASTLTMQLSDLIQPQVLIENKAIQKGSLIHKILQIYRALGLELKWTKNEILEAYLNLIHLRGEHQGIPAVSWAYLDKDPLAIDESESFVIAAMISSPNQSLNLLKQRACGLFKKIKGETLGCEAVFLASEKFFRTSRDLKTNLPSSFGRAPHLARRLFQISKDSPILESTIDGKLQAEVIAILEKNIQRLRGSNVKDSAAIVIDNESGKVLAYVGAISTSESPHVDGVQSYRQAGSSLKPFFYAEGIQKKLITASSILLDDPTAISWGADVYRPTNYDKHFFGPVTVREALGSSLNVPAVKAVLTIGLHESYKVLQTLKFSELNPPDFYGVSMALGAVEVRLDELANAYRTLANQGSWAPLHFIEQEAPVESLRIYSPETSFILSSILSDPNARSIGFGWDSPLETPFWTAVKTGTSKDYRDNWCVGFSQKYTVAVWAGNFDAQAMNKVSGVSGAGPSWFEIMSLLHANEKSIPPSPPEQVVTKEVRPSWSSSLHKEYFIAGTEPKGEIVEQAFDKKPQFVFPAQGSVLVKDPHLSQDHIALYVRFKGVVPEGTLLTMNGKILGSAKSPFKITELKAGDHLLALESAQGSILTKINFKIKGAE